MKTFLYGLLLGARIVNGQMVDSQQMDSLSPVTVEPSPVSDVRDYVEPSPPMKDDSDRVEPSPPTPREFDEYEICYKQCKIQTPDELTDIDISRIDVIIDGETVRVRENDQIPLENGDVIRVDNRGKVERVRDGRVVLDTHRGRPQRLTDDQVDRLVRGENITLADRKVRFDEDRSEIVICGTGRPILTRIDEREYRSELSDSDIDSLRRGEKIERDGIMVELKGDRLVDEDGREVELSDEDIDLIRIPSLDVVEIEKLVDGDVIRYVDDKVVRVSDWEEVMMSASDSEKMCFHSCTNKAATNPVDFYAEMGDTQSSPASVWGLSAAILFVR